MNEMTKKDATDARTRLILALDAPDEQSSMSLLDRVDDKVGMAKVGLELFTACGPSIVDKIRRRGLDVFLDLKLHDIPNTVAGAVRSAVSSGASMLTVHTAGGKKMLERAVESSGGEIRILGVTLLTSLAAGDLEPVAIVPNPAEVVLRRASLAAESGCWGIVCSPKEIRAIRSAAGTDIAIVAPGIRPANAEAGDQKRTATPGSAISEGADYLVVGRPIREAADPASAASLIVEEIADALATR